MSQDERSHGGRTKEEGIDELVLLGNGDVGSEKLSRLLRRGMRQLTDWLDE